MQSTSMGVQFEVNDLDASYELVGTSDNYSFQYKLGKGSDLVNDIGEAANEIIPLKGNYGSFEVKVFAVSNIGIRSEFILGNVNISPPTFEGSFTFNNLRILEGFGGVDDTLNIEYAPESPGDELIVTQQFAGKSVQLAWELIPPIGHPQEGQSVDTELLSDVFFSGIIVNIKNDGQLIGQQDLGSSEALAQSLLSNDVVGILNNYRDFSLNLNTAAFNDLDLQRNISVELIAVDSLGGTCTGTLSGYNPPPEFSNFSYNLRGSDISFSWFINDLDYKNIDVNILAVGKNVDLFDTENYDSSVNYLQSINETVDSNKVWDSSKNVSYESGDFVLWKDSVYKALSSHQSSFSAHPINGYPWENLGSKVFFETKSESLTETVFSNTQLWGYKYYYTFQAFDDFGAGDVMLLGEDGILQVQGSEDARLFPYESIVQIGNLSYIEDADDFVFNWNVVDQDGNAVDLNQYKFAFKESSLPTMLGLSGSLYDIQSNQYLTGITQGENGIGLNLDENGNTQIVGGLASTKVFDTFRFTRELNNQVYDIGGFPSSYSVFDDAVYYQQDDHVSVTEILYKSITSQVDAGQKTIRPEYYDWENSENYQLGDCAVYNGNIYQLNDSCGPAHTEGIFNFETLHASGDLVVAPINQYKKFYPASLYGTILTVVNSGEFTTNLTNVVDNALQSLSIKINDQTKTVASYDGYDKTIILDTDLNALPQVGDSFEINGFEYQGGSVVVHNNKLFRSRGFQSGDTIATPGNDPSKWTQVSAFSQVPCEIYKCINANNFNANESDVDWQIQDPESSDKFDGYISGYSERVNEWSSEQDFFISDFVVYANDLWSGVIDSGPSSETGVIVPGSDSNVWVNNVGGQDIVFDYNQGDIVYALGAVYKAAANDPIGAPIEAISNPGSESLSTYQGTEWIPYWQRETIYDDVVFGHVGIPESGKRSVAIELGIVDSNNQVFSLTRLNAYNQQPSILPEGFNVDSTGETTKIKFNFNYAFQSQEKTTKVNLYRSSEPNFEITGADGLPQETIGEGSNLVKVTLGAADATFGEKKTQIVDSPPIPKINGVDQVTGYYYKILPFDDFGSGDLFGVDDNQEDLDQCLVYPKNYSTNNPNGLPGPVYRTTSDDIPGSVVGFNGNVAFENFFLNWFHPEGQISTDDNGKILYNNFIPNDLSHYEVWISEYNKLELGSLNVYLKNQKDPLQPIDFSNDKGYRRIRGDISSAGPIPPELQDPASGITNATQAFTISANGVEVETSYPGKTNDTRYFWVRAVDHAGNKSPFTGISGLQGDTHEITGLGLTLGVASATDIEDFEINMTESFGNTIALVPNNPFKNNSNTEGEISWTQHYLFNEGTGFIVDESVDGTSDGYVWWDRNDENKSLNIDDYYVKLSGNVTQTWGESSLIERGQIIEWSDIDTDNQDQLNLKNVYFSGVNYKTSIEHPANNSTDNDTTSTVLGFDDGDFVIARNTNGIATPVYHAFANALIGTANIANAAIKNAHVNDLSADKITAGQIKGHRIEVFHSGADQSNNYGSIASKGFSGIEDSPVSGFVLSGDGSFAFQQGDAALTFEDDNLVLYGKFRQKNRLDFDFVDVDVEPNFFAYQETDAGFEPADDTANPLSIRASFRNSTAQPGDVRFKMEVVSGNQRYDVFRFDDTGVNGSYDISGFVYNGDLFTDINGSHIATGSFDVAGFDDIIQHYNQVADSVVLTVGCTGISTIQKSATITRIIDGKAGNPGLSPTFRGIWNNQTDYIYIPSAQTSGGRGDVVEFTGYGSILPHPSNKYYIAKGNSAPPNNIQVPYDVDNGGLNSNYWQEFGATFESIATDWLLTKEALVTEKLTMGVGGSATKVPHSGIIVSADFTGGLLNVFPPENEPYQIIDNTNYSGNYNTPGFLLARTDDGVVFDVGGTGIVGQTGYIRFDSKSGKLEIAGSFINNTVLDDDAFLVDGSFDNFIGLDNFTSFIGGGYNNKLTGSNDRYFENLGSAILGGAWNTMNSRFSAIAGGYSGYCADNFSFIGGGYRNTMPLEEPGDHQGANFIGCGIDNQINGGASQTIVNGVRNTIEGLTGDYVPVFDRDNGFFSKRILGRYEGSKTYENIAFSKNNYGWTSIESGIWFPVGIDLGYHQIAETSSIGDYYTAGFDKSLYIGGVDSLVSENWVYHVDFKWMYMIVDFESKLYSNETLDDVYAYFAGGNSVTADWYRFSRVGAKPGYIKAEYGSDFSKSRFFKMENSVLKYSDDNPPTSWSLAF